MTKKLCIIIYNETNRAIVLIKQGGFIYEEEIVIRYAWISNGCIYDSLRITGT